jgi:hypothetical protein
VFEPLFSGSSPRGRRCRPLGVSSTAVVAAPPDLHDQPLMDVDFAITCPLVRPALPRIRFLFVGSRRCSTLPSDSSSRSCPCASLDFTSIRLSGDFHPQAVEHVRHTGFARYARRCRALDAPGALLKAWQLSKRHGDPIGSPDCPPLRCRSYTPRCATMPRRRSSDTRRSGPKPSDLFEQWIHRIHDLIEGFDAEVTWDDRIIDPDQPSLRRQIDVTVRRDGRLTIIECRLYRQPPERKVD